MKRNLDLYRDILLKHEELSEDNGIVEFDPDDFPGEALEIVEAHVELLGDAGFLVPADGLIGSETLLAGRMTYYGHEFLDTVRDPEVWRKTKEVGEQVGTGALDVLAEIAKGFLKTQIKRLTGVEV